MTSFAWGALFGAVVGTAVCLAIAGEIVLAAIVGVGALAVAFLAHRGGHV